MELLHPNISCKETWDPKSSMCFEMNKQILQGFEVIVQLSPLGLFMHKDLTWTIDNKLFGQGVKWDVETTYIPLERVQDFINEEEQIIEMNCKFT